MITYDSRAMLRYLISWSDPTSRLYDVEISFDAPSDDPRLLLPVWRPGRYLVQNYAANVRSWSARSGDGAPLRMWKEALSEWRVAAAAGTRVVVSYRYYAGKLDAGSSFLDPHEAYFNGSNLFMLVEGLRQQEAALTVAAPAHWRVETQLARGDGDHSHSFVARDYDHLIDSPLIAAESMTRHTFTSAGATIHLVVLNDRGIDTEQYVEPLQRIIAAQSEIFGGLPLREYRFLVHLGAVWHGVEHESSCSIVAKRQEMLGAGPGSDGYDRFLSIASHEFFHVWNIKRLLPARFAPYDYFAPTPTHLLWFFEGGTSYYGDLALARSGVWSDERYLEHLAREIETLENAPAREHLAVSQASFDSWLHDPSSMHDRTNGWFSFYNKGELLCAVLDLQIRQRTGGAHSLDDVVRLLWQRYGVDGRGVPESGVQQAACEIAPVEDFFSRYVDGTDALPYAETLATAGIELASSMRDGGSPGLGCTLRSTGGILVVDTVLQDTPGAQAGLLPGDELIAIDELRVQNAGEVQRVLGAVSDATVELVVSRSGQLRRFSLRVAADSRITIALHAEPANTRRDEWLWRNR